MLKLLLSAGIAAIFSTPAQAGDFATLNVLGFSEDGSTFVFEEYGVQDGSGFPYSNRFYIDTATDQFVSGSPVRVRIDDETSTLEDARAQAKAGGEAIIADSDLFDGFMAGFNAVTESSADPFRMSVNPRPVVPPIDDEIEFRLTEKEFLATGVCESMGVPILGFELKQIALTPDQTAKILLSDSGVPASRNCPTGYRLGGVYTYFAEGQDPVYAVMIAVRSFGFEGPDYRWMAVATQDTP